MRDSLNVGDKVQFAYEIPTNKTVPHLYPEAPEFVAMPAVFATAFMVGLMEWACLKVLADHLEPGEASFGVHIDVSHTAPTLPGQIVTVDAECTAINGRRIAFHVRAHDGLDIIGEGRHERAVMPLTHFELVCAKKAKAAGVASLAARAQAPAPKRWSAMSLRTAHEEETAARRAAGLSDDEDEPSGGGVTDETDHTQEARSASQEFANDTEKTTGANPFAKISGDAIND